MGKWQDFIGRGKKPQHAESTATPVVDRYGMRDHYDLEPLTHIAKKVYPRKYAEVTFPDEGDDLLLVARNDKGQAVGYATLSPRTREIADLAVDPDIGMRQAPALVAALMHEVLKTGGTWKADMRQSTSYRLLEKWADRCGIDTMQQGESYRMKTGLFHSEPVFSVRFSIPDPTATRTAIDKMLQSSTRHPSSSAPSR
jgi:hypothetical protein